MYKSKKRQGWFIRLLDRISKELEEGGKQVHRNIEIDIKVSNKINKACGLSSEIKNAKRFLQDQCITGVIVL